ncbi:MAG: DUF6653 family protein [Thiohalomonadales bacterium]
MNIEKKIANLSGLKSVDDWLAHANPWSVWSRFISLPFIILAIWSRVWIGYYSWVPIIILFIWIAINPKLFSKTNSTDNWASKAVLGEMIWTRRGEIPVPERHQSMIRILTLLQVVGGAFLFFGLYQLHFWSTLTGTILVYVAKMWFLDRMVWIFEDMKHHEEYNRLLY